MSLQRKRIGAIPVQGIQDKNMRDALLRASENIMELLRRIEELERQLALARRS